MLYSNSQRNLRRSEPYQANLKKRHAEPIVSRTQRFSLMNKWEEKLNAREPFECTNPTQSVPRGFLFVRIVQYNDSTFHTMNTLASKVHVYFH